MLSNTLGILGKLFTGGSAVKRVELLKRYNGLAWDGIERGSEVCD